MRQAHLGIADNPAPEWNVPTWFNLPDGKTSLTVSDISESVIYLYCFQSWCPGCHSHGFPTMAATRCLLYTSPSPRDRQKSRMPSSA